MSLNKLVGGDCGGNNTLVQLSSIVSRDAGLSQPQSQADSFVNEYLAQHSQTPQTFNMHELLNKVPEVTTKNTQMQLPRNSPVQLPRNYIDHFARPRLGFSPMFHKSNCPHIPRQSFVPQLNCDMLPPHTHYRPRDQMPSYIQHQPGYQGDVKSTSSDDVQAKAKEYVDSTKDDSELAYNQFMSFMKKVSAGEMNFGETAEGEQKKMSKDEILDEMAEKYKDEWAKLSDVTDIWNSETANGIAKEYSFTEGNVMLENKSALEIGKEKLKMGDIPGAVLCFEAAAQQQPDSAEAWFLLGTTQAENEQDPWAITALKKSLEIDPRQLEAYITLAAAYTNENLAKHAFLALHDWLKASPKYSDILPQDIDPSKLDMKELETHVKTIYLRAAQLNPTQIDPDVQNALGVAFNISQEYDKAVDCFKTALMIANQDSKLWNRLGATLANSDRSEEAVSAYHEALNLEPGYIRARYNIGITCMNLGAHRQAAEHFLVALNQQIKAKNLHPGSSTTDKSSATIWTTLRMVCSFMGEHDVAKLVDERNLSDLNKFFEVE